jgi:DNA replicative helicase MCM subunit Mcm2 (Cdc46/Mcm family)
LSSSRAPAAPARAETCRRFLREHSEREDNAPKFKYMEQLQAIVNRQRGLLQISMDDLAASEGDVFAEKVAANTKHYVDLFAEAADAEMQTLQAGAPRRPAGGTGR